MREYINIYQLDDLPHLAKRDDYFVVSRDALSYKLSGEAFIDFMVQEVDIYNADKLLGYGLSFTEPLLDHQLLTFDETENAWVNRELDIDSIFRFPEFEANKFLKLNFKKEVITSDVHISDLVIDSSNVSNYFLAVDNSGTVIEYIDIYAYVDDQIDNRHDAIMPILRAEIARSIAEDARLENLIIDETRRASTEEQRIEDKFDTMIPIEVDLINERIDQVVIDFDNKLQLEIDRATGEEERIEALIVDLPSLVEIEKQRALEEERRLENLIIAGIDSLEVKIQDCCEYLKGLVEDEERRAKDEEKRLEDMILEEIARAILEEERLELLIEQERQRAIGEEQRIEDLIPDIIDSIPRLTGNRNDGASARIVKEIYDSLQSLINGSHDIIDSISSLTGNRNDGASARIVKLIYDMAQNNSTRIDNLDIPDLGDVEFPEEQNVMSIVTQWFTDNQHYQDKYNGTDGAYSQLLPSGFLFQCGGGVTGAGGKRMIKMLKPYGNIHACIVSVVERSASGWMQSHLSAPYMAPTIYGHDVVGSSSSNISIWGARVDNYGSNGVARGGPGWGFGWMTMGMT